MKSSRRPRARIFGVGIIACAIGLSLLACGNDASSSSSGDGGGGGGGGGGGNANYCADLATRAASCDAGAVDPAKCAKQKTCYENLVRADGIGPLETCLTTRACDKSDDSCLAEIGDQFVASGPYKKFQDDCLAKRTSCAGQGTFSSDDCVAQQAALFNDATFNATQACLARPCAEIQACLTGVYADAGCN